MTAYERGLLEAQRVVDALKRNTRDFAHAEEVLRRRLELAEDNASPEWFEQFLATAANKLTADVYA